VIILFRIDVQQRVRQWGREPRDDDRQKIEHLQKSLAMLIAELNRLQSAAGVFNSAESHHRCGGESLEVWDTVGDGLDEESAPSESAPSESALPPSALAPASAVIEQPSAPSDNNVAVEHQTICLPSNGYVNPGHEDIELSLRKKQARAHLNQLRELIAEKSFQYSDVIRAAPRKGIWTRARGTVKGINMRISFHCQVYSLCRSRMINLGADQAILQEIRELKKQDIKASTAILKPNTPGSTTLHLSWIWHDVASHILPGADADLSSTDPATILECTLISLLYLFIYSSPHIFQSNVSIGCVPEHKRTNGVKNVSW